MDEVSTRSFMSTPYTPEDNGHTEEIESLKAQQATVGAVEDFMSGIEESRLQDAVPVYLKSINRLVLLCRPELDIYMMSGQLPAAFTTMIMEAAKKGKVSREDAEKKVEEMSDEEFEKTIYFMRDITMAAFVAPKMVLKVKDPSKEVPVSVLRRSTLEEVFKWVMEGAPDVPVKTEGGGETTIGALTKSGDEQPVLRDSPAVPDIPAEVRDSGEVPAGD